MTLKEFNNKYVYKTDKERFNTSLDIWELPKNSNIIRADCESYCRFIKNNIDGFSDWDYCYCKLNGIGHCVLYKNGDAIDCNTQSVVTFENYCKIYKVTEFKKYNWFVVFSKILFSNMYLFYRKVKK